MNERLDPIVARRLTRLKLMLGDAISATADRTAIGRLRAVIALDGVAEQAMGVAFDQLPESPRWSFPKKLAQLREAFPSWSADGANAVSALHEVRNQAQHHGVIPDAEEVAGWPAEVDRFVRSLVGAVVGLDLTQVHSFQIVETAGLRGLLEQAELALDEGEPEASFEASWSALQEARRHWSQQRARYGQSIAPPRIASLTRDVSKALRDGLAATEEFVEISAFATDFGEYLWLSAQERERHHRAKPTLEDARRALVFVLTWIARWESFSASFPEDRWERWHDEPAPTSGFDHDAPVIIDVREAEISRPGHTGYLFQLADIPVDDDGLPYHPRWDGPLYAAFRELHSEPDQPLPDETNVYIGPGGKLTLEVPSDSAVDSHYLLSFVETLIARTQERYEELIHARRAKSEAESELADPYRGLVGSLRQDDVEITGVRVQLAATERRDGPTEDQVIVELRLGDGLSSIDLMNAVSRDLGVNLLHGSSRELWFPREEMPPDEIKRVLSKAVDLVRQQNAEECRQVEQRAQTQQTVLAELRTALGNRLRPTDRD